MTIREYTEGYPVDIVEHNGRTCLLALNEGGNREVIIDLQDILAATTEQRVTVDRDDLRAVLDVAAQYQRSLEYDSERDNEWYTLDDEQTAIIDRLRAALKGPTP
jgi:hypothetical protein